jgi:hypothetical protein
MIGLLEYVNACDRACASAKGDLARYLRFASRGSSKASSFEERGSLLALIYIGPSNKLLLRFLMSMAKQI